MIPTHCNICYSADRKVALTEKHLRNSTTVVGSRRLTAAQLTMLIITPAIKACIFHQRKGLFCTGKHSLRSAEIIFSTTAGAFALHSVRPAAIPLPILLNTAHTQLAAAVTAPAISQAACHCQRMLIAGRHTGNALKRTFRKALRRHYLMRDTTVFRIVSAQAQLTFVVSTPGVNIPVCSSGKNMIPAYCNFFNSIQLGFCTRASHLHGESSVGNLIASITDSQLPICIITPSPNFTIGLKCHGKFFSRKHFRRCKIICIFNDDLKTACIMFRFLRIRNNDATLCIQQTARIEPGIIVTHATISGQFHNRAIAGPISEQNIIFRITVSFISIGAIALAQIEAHIVILADSFFIYNDILFIGNRQHLGQ